MTLDVKRHNEMVLKTLEIGDLVEIRGWTYSHWGVYVGEGYVVHLIPIDVKGKLKDSLPSMHCASGNGHGCVKREKLMTVAANNKVEKNNDKDEIYTPLPSEEIKERALSKVGTASYNLVSNNCEHFATLCRYGKEMSQQVDVALKCGTCIAAVSVGTAGAVAYGKYTGGELTDAQHTGGGLANAQHTGGGLANAQHTGGGLANAQHTGGNDGTHQRERIVLPRMEPHSEQFAALDRLHVPNHKAIIDKIRGVPIGEPNFAQYVKDCRVWCDLDPCPYSDLRRNLAYLSGWRESGIYGAVNIPLVHLPGVGFTRASLSSCGFAMDPTWKVVATSCLKVIGTSIKVTTALQCVGAVVAVAVVGWLTYKGACALFGK